MNPASEIDQSASLEQFPASLCVCVCVCGLFIGFRMPKNPQNWPFLNWTQFGLDRDTPVCDCLRPWSNLLNRHGCVVHPCESCFDSAKLTRSCGLPV
ncbi:hypothetical protein F383_39017 [Gossypium arboreum]|uniref:Uncharacterized protein n=1 Tax=Gossypium arboreum TaxID=29729 RepID=A0A0B0MIK1_GOSAR|nr:hypothetical protein F383_39017 [Gossypium arboreum]